MQDSQGGLTRAEQRGRIPSLALLPTLLGMKLRIQMAFWAASRLHCTSDYEPLFLFKDE